MNSQTLQFDIYQDFKFFTVVFEAVSENRNLLMDVIYDGFHLDVVDLQRTHTVLYNKINNKMQRKANDYWNIANKQINEIPPSAYHESAKDRIVESIKKASLSVVFLFLISVAFAQVHIDFGGGIAKVTAEPKVEASVVPTMKISVGYQFENNIVAEAMMEPTLTRQVNTPDYFGLKAGYNFCGFIPSVGYLYNYRNADDITMNRWEVGYALKYQVQINENGGLYAEGMYTKSSIGVNIGFHIVF